jgi:hypothetical protein
VGWHFVPPGAVPRQPQDVFVEAYVREALIRLNPAKPERADEVIYKPQRRQRAQRKKMNLCLTGLKHHQPFEQRRDTP